MPRTLFGKTKTQDKPYAIYKNANGWEWRVLKTYKHKENENDYSRWFVAATSPMMHEEGRFEMGDTYARDVHPAFSDCIMAAVPNMILGIEPDGYTHS